MLKTEDLAWNVWQDWFSSLNNNPLVKERKMIGVKSLPVSLDRI